MAPPKNDPVSDVEEDDHTQSEDENELSNNVVTKYKTAGDIANRELRRGIGRVERRCRANVCAMGGRANMQEFRVHTVRAVKHSIIEYLNPGR